MSEHGVHVHGPHDHAVEHAAQTPGSLYKAEAKRYAAEKKDIEKDARKHEAAYKSWNEKSELALHPHHFLAISMTLLQIAIALASITVLTQKRWLLYGAALSAFGGAVLGVIAWL